jgi:hypothetical protein
LSLEIVGEKVVDELVVVVVVDSAVVLSIGVDSVDVDVESLGTDVSVAVEPVSTGGSDSRKVIPIAPEARSPTPNRHAKASTYFARRSAL